MGGHPDGGCVHTVRKPATAIGTMLLLRHVRLGAVGSARIGASLIVGVLVARTEER